MQSKSISAAARYDSQDLVRSDYATRNLVYRTVASDCYNHAFSGLACNLFRFSCILGTYHLAAHLFKIGYDGSFALFA